MIRVGLVDDHQKVHDAVHIILKSIEDITLVGQVYRGEDADNLCQIKSPDILLMDVIMPGIDGSDATEIIQSKYKNIKIIALSSYKEYEYIRSMLDKGCVGYIVKDALVAELAETIRAVMSGTYVFSNDVIQTIMHPNEPDVSVNQFGLSERELSVLAAMAHGLNNNEIADELSVTERTVRFHISNILKKFNVSSRSEVLVLAAKSNLV